MENNILFGKALNLGQLIQSNTRQNSSLTNQSLTSFKSSFDGILSNKLATNDSTKALVPKTTLKDIKDSVNSQAPIKPSKLLVKKENMIDYRQEKLAAKDVSKINETVKTETEAIEGVLKSEVDALQVSASETTKTMANIEQSEANLKAMTEEITTLQQLIDVISTLLNSVVPEQKENMLNIDVMTEQVFEATGKDLSKIQAILDKIVSSTGPINKLENVTTLQNHVEVLKTMISDLQKKSPDQLTKSDVKETLSNFSDVMDEVKSEMKAFVNDSGSNKGQMNSESESQTGSFGNTGGKALSNKGSVKSDAAPQTLTSMNTSKNEASQIKADANTNKELKNNNGNLPGVSTNHMVRTETNTIAFSKTALQSTENRVEIFRNIMDQVVSGVKTQLKQTETGSMMTLKLSPEHLGNVEVKLELVKGSVLAEFKVESQIVKGALEANLSDLKNALTDKGYQVENMNIQVDKDGKQHKHQQDTPDQSKQKNKHDENSQDETEKNYFKNLIEEMRHSV